MKVPVDNIFCIRVSDDLLLHEDLVQLLPMVGEANAMSEELNKKANFEVMLMAPYLLHGKKEGRTEVSSEPRVQVQYSSKVFEQLLCRLLHIFMIERSA